jgi:hypothetical protein
MIAIQMTVGPEKVAIRLSCRFARGGDLLLITAGCQAGQLLPDGKVLIAGGVHDQTLADADSAEIYDPLQVPSSCLVSQNLIARDIRQRCCRMATCSYWRRFIFRSMYTTAELYP